MRSMGKKGFTLVEIIVVMVVVGILAAITVPSLGKYIDNGKKRDCEINRKALLARLESDRALAPGVTMAEVLAENTDISCPSGGVYSAPDDNTVECSVHGKDSALSAVDEGVGGELVEISEVESELPGDEGTLMPTESEVEEKPTEPIEGEDGCVVVTGIEQKMVGFGYYSIAKFAQDNYEAAQKDQWKSFPLDKNRIWYDEHSGKFYYVGISNQGSSGVTYKFNSDGSYEYIFAPYQNTDEVFEVNLKNMLLSSTLEDILNTNSYSIARGTILYNEKNKKYYICSMTTSISPGENWESLFGGKHSVKLFRELSLCQ